MLAIVIPILVSLGCGIVAGIFLGGFWWVVFGLLVGYMEAAILCYKYEDIWGNLDYGFIIFFLIFPTLIGAIAAGIIAGGFGWVMLGLLIGLVTGLVLYGAYGEGGKVFAALLPILMPAGAVLALLYVSRRWYIVLLGIVAGALASFVLISPHVLWLKAQERRLKKIEQQRKEEEEAERKRLEEIERNRPVEEKLAELESEALEVYKKNSAELKNAKRAFSEIKVDIDKKFEEFIFNPERAISKELLGGIPGYSADENHILLLQANVERFATRYRVSTARAKLENDIYTANRKKALLLAERLKDIYDKLTAKQKERKIEDTAQALKIGSVKVKIPDSIPNVNALTVKFNNERKQEIVDYFLGYDKFKRETNLSGGAGDLAFLAGGVIKVALSKYEVNKKIKERFTKRQNKLIRTKEKLEAGRLQADAFSERAAELNRALEGTMSAYEKMFVEIYNSLYPPGDASKSKEAREANKKNGGDYFTDEEAEAVLHLGTTVQFLLQLVDTKFEGENDE